MSKIIFSKEQEDIFAFCKHGIQNLIVQAVAGAGKTTTLIECVNQIESSKKILLLAHNKSTKDTLKSKIGDNPNVRIYTLHGLAWRMFTEHFDYSPIIDDDKYRTYINQNIDNITSDSYKELSSSSKLIYKSNVFDLVNKARHNLKQSEKEISKLAKKKYGIRLIADEAHIVSKILKWGSENKETVDYQDLLSFPYEFGYFTKKYLADIIMLDEAQDASIAQQDVVSRCFKRNTRLFAFGDKDQTINSWCGSDTDAFEHLKDANVFRRDAITLPLTTNYRCGTKIIEYAKRYTDNNIKPRDGAPDGEIRHNMSLNNVVDGDMILCRNTAPLMEVYRNGVANGKKMYFRGEELGKNLKIAVDCAYGSTIMEIIFSLKKRLMATWEFLTKEYDLNPKESMTDSKIVSLFDTIKTLESLPKSVTTRKELERFIKEVFSDEGKEGIQLSTIHRAKGLEADNVFIVCPSLIPSKLATLDWEKEEERHLQYVMCTRPKNTLNFVTEQEIKPNLAYSENNSFYETLLEFKKEIEIEREKEINN
jgi:superfamily I DNA/RNA helicase